MRSLPAGLSTGRVGQASALGLTLLALSALWLLTAQPLIDWYNDRAARLTERTALVQRMEDLVARLPALEAQLSGTAAAARGDQSLADVILTGNSDAIAGAELQQHIQDMALRSHLTLTSTETLPATAAGDYRRIGLRISATSAWKAFVTLLQAIDQASPRMLADDIQVRGPGIVAKDDLSLQISFTVHAFRAGLPAAGQR